MSAKRSWQIGETDYCFLLGLSKQAKTMIGFLIRLSKRAKRDFSTMNGEFSEGLNHRTTFNKGLFILYGIAGKIEKFSTFSMFSKLRN